MTVYNRYLDSHAHILSEEFEQDFDDVLQRIRENHIEKVMIITTSAEEARRGLDFVQKDPEHFQLAYGIHPEDIRTVTEDRIREMEEIVQDPRISAVGEIGLDYYWEKDTKEEQKELFIRQIEIAKKINKPILVHSRDAMQDTFDIMKEHRTDGVMHCFSGSAEMAVEFTKFGYYIALGGPVTFKNARHAKAVCAAIDEKYLLSETDCPYMAPEPVRGRRNEPANIVHIVKVMAEVRNTDTDHLSKVIMDNYMRLLGKEEA